MLSFGRIWVSVSVVIHLASYPVGTFPWDKTDHSPPSSAEVKECVELYLHSKYCFMA